MDDPVATGIDVVDVARFAERLAQYPRMRSLVFTDGEYARAAGARVSERLAARFAAKEAAFKALGAGWPQVRYRDVEIDCTGDGAPLLQLHGRAATLAGGRRAALTMSHAAGIAVAHVTLMGGR